MKKLFIILASFVFLLIGGYYYIYSSIHHWLEEHNLRVRVDKISPRFKGLQMPDISLKNIFIENLDAASNFHKLALERADLEFLSVPRLTPLTLEIRYKLKGVKVNNHSEIYLDVQEGRGEFKALKDHYILPSLSLNLVQFGVEVAEKKTAKGVFKPHIGHLSLNKVNLEGDYSKSTHALNFKLEVPLSKDLPKSQSYSLQALGKFKMRPELFEAYLRPHSTILPMEGKATFTINHFSNFLTQLHQIKAISTLEDNLGSILGFPIPKLDFITDRIKEFMTNAVTLDLKVSPKGAYIGPLQVYP